MHKNISIKTNITTLEAPKRTVTLSIDTDPAPEGVAEGLAAEDGWPRLPGITRRAWTEVLICLDRDSELRSGAGAVGATCLGSSSMAAGRGGLDRGGAGGAAASSSEADPSEGAPGPGRWPQGAPAGWGLEL